MRESNRTYEGIRKLALMDAKRRMSALSHLGLKWEVIDKDNGDGVIEKRGHYSMDEDTLDQEFSRNEYAMIREIKYIIWRFELTDEEINKNKKPSWKDIESDKWSSKTDKFKETFLR